MLVNLATKRSSKPNVRHNTPSSDITLNFYFASADKLYFQWNFAFCVIYNKVHVCLQYFGTTFPKDIQYEQNTITELHSSHLNRHFNNNLHPGWLHCLTKNAQERFHKRTNEICNAEWWWLSVLFIGKCSCTWAKLMKSILHVPHYDWNVIPFTQPYTKGCSDKSSVMKWHVHKYHPCGT